jgi:mono/diheme cytochrome c family protein
VILLFSISMRRSLPVVLLVTVAVACNQQMNNEPRYDPLESSDFLADGMTARPRVPGTIAREHLRIDEAFFTGKSGGRDVDAFPFPVTRATLQRGRERFDIFCSPCHGRVGQGDGMVVSRGFRSPPSYHLDRLREAPIGHFVDVMSNGFGAMPSYASRVPPQDRWAIAAYIRALQLSQRATLADVPEAERQTLRGEAP